MRERTENVEVLLARHIDQNAFRAIEQQVRIGGGAALAAVLRLEAEVRGAVALEELGAAVKLYCLDVYRHLVLGRHVLHAEQALEQLASGQQEVHLTGPCTCMSLLTACERKH